MKPVREPKDNFYTVPRTVGKDNLHYVVVQITTRGYAVAECDGHYSDVPHFVIISQGMSHLLATALARELTLKRLEKEIPDAPKH